MTILIVLLVNKYRTDYENAILKADDMVDILMLEQVLSINTSKPDHTTFEKIGPLLKVNSEVFKLKMLVPVTSLGIKSGVN
jgi:hypothetical protein